ITSTTATPNGTTIGASGGTQTHVLAESELPSHDHSFIGGSFTATFTAGQIASGADRSVANAGGAKTATTGSGGAHNNMSPFWLATIYIR
ncbi:hypothetical protein ABTM13_19470, partial [Acinetobacter baumannii]